ncbi:MAG: hypothetical protein K0A93_06580 [Desulfuromonadaceae bacterium]|nr:hypothetical protein [Desulfuromonadaceae bacterium]
MKKAYLEVVLEDINSKFDLVLEGHELLRSEIRDLSRKTDERFDLVDFKIDTLNQKIDAVAADLKATDIRLSDKIDGVATDLKAHRDDTEAHHGVYRVKES